MAITINFYLFKKRINSTMRPSDAVPAVTPAATYKCILKAGCDIMSPVISLDYGIANNPTGLNYAYIPDFNRYYFVKTWQWEDRLWNIYLEEDTLASFKTNIMASTGYVLRSGSQYDLTITDEMYPTKPQALVRNTQPDTNPWTSSMSSGRFVVGIINNQPGAMGAVSYYVMTNSEFKSLCALLMNNTQWLNVPTDFYNGGLDENLLKTLFNPIQYIASVKWFPFVPPTLTDIADLSYGWWHFNGFGAHPLNTGTAYYTSFRFTLPDHPQSSRGDYLNCAPFTRHLLCAGPFGDVALDANEFHAGSLICDMAVDCITGAAQLWLTSSTTLGTYYKTISADMGVDIQIAQMGVDRLTQAETIATGAMDTYAAAMGTASSATNITNLVNPVGGALGVAAQGAQAVSTGIHAIANGIRSSLPQMQSSGINGSIAAYYRPPILKTEYYELVPEDLQEKGRPLAQQKALNTLSGFVMLECGDLGGTGGTINEQAAVKAYLESGCFLE